MENMTLAMRLEDLHHMPRFGGNLIYWHGSPFNPESLNFSDILNDCHLPKTLKEIIFDYYQWRVTYPQPPEPAPLIFEILREYGIYYAHAPMWQMVGPLPGFKLWIKQSFDIKDWDSLDAWRMKGLDFGLDPF